MIFLDNKVSPLLVFIASLSCFIIGILFNHLVHLHFNINTRSKGCPSRALKTLNVPVQTYFPFLPHPYGPSTHNLLLSYTDSNKCKSLLLIRSPGSTGIMRKSGNHCLGIAFLPVTDAYSYRYSGWIGGNNVTLKDQYHSDYIDHKSLVNENILLIPLFLQIKEIQRITNQIQRFSVDNVSGVILVMTANLGMLEFGKL